MISFLQLSHFRRLFEITGGVPGGRPNSGRKKFRYCGGDGSRIGEQVRWCAAFGQLALKCKRFEAQERRFRQSFMQPRAEDEMRPSLVFSLRLVAPALLVMLSGCGGGSSSSAVNPPPGGAHALVLSAFGCGLATPSGLYSPYART